MYISVLYMYVHGTYLLLHVFLLFMPFYNKFACVLLVGLLTFAGMIKNVPSTECNVIHLYLFKTIKENILIIIHYVTYIVVQNLSIYYVMYIGNLYYVLCTDSMYILDIVYVRYSNNLKPFKIIIILKRKC